MAAYPTPFDAHKSAEPLDTEEGGEGVGGVPKKNRPGSTAAAGVGFLLNAMVEVPPLRSRPDGRTSMVEGERDVLRGMGRMDGDAMHQRGFLTRSNKDYTF